MIAFHNDSAIKAHYLARVQAHRAADEIRHGYYWNEGKGCAVGCTLHSGSRHAYETELGIPSILASLEDGIFEALRPPDDTAWPEDFLTAIPIGADLTMVWPRFALLLLSDAQHGVLRYVKAGKFSRQRRAIKAVVSYFKQWAETKERPASAVAAAAYAASSVAAAAYAAAAYAAATAAAYAAAAHTEGGYTARLWQRDALLQLLREAPVGAAENRS